MTQKQNKISKTKTPKKKESKEIQKVVEKKELIELFEKQAVYSTHPDNIYLKMGENVAKIRAGDKDPKLMEYIHENILKVNDFSRNHSNLANTVPAKMAPSVVEVANNLIEEYNCTTTLEKTLCEIIANSYGKVLSISRKLDGSLDFEYFGNERNGFISILSKELERANRSYLGAINELINLKQPKTTLSIKTQNAYIAQNQQINSNPPQNDETINP